MAGALVLDSYALIAYLENEDGAGRVQEALREGEQGRLQLLMSAVNWGEVYYSIHRAKGAQQADETLLVIDQLPIDIVLPDKEHVLAASRLKAAHAIAFGDCFAAALATINDCQVATGDKEFCKLGDRVKVLWL